MNYFSITSLSLFFYVLIASACSAQGENKKVIQSDSSLYPHELLLDFEGHPVVFYNVENLFDTLDAPGKNDVEFTPDGKKGWNTERYNDKLEKLAEVITFPPNHQPLMVGLCEVETLPVVVDLMQTGKLAASTYRVAHFDSPDSRGIDVALAYDSQRFYMLHQEAVFVDIGPRPTRDILYVKGLLKDSIELHVFVNHWPSRIGGVERSEVKRVAAAKRLRHKVDSLNKVHEHPNILIMGDFNDNPDDISIDRALGAKAPVNAKTNGLVNLSRGPYKKEGAGTYNYKGNWDMLDQFIVSFDLWMGHNGLWVKDGKKYIIDDDRFLYFPNSGGSTPNKTYGGNNYYGGYSDHLAIYLYLERH